MKKYLLTTYIILIASLIIPMIVSAAVVSKAPSGLGLIGYWNFNEGTGTIAGDFSNNRANKGTFVNGPVWTTGKFDKGLLFNGNDSYVSIPTTGALTSAGSISFWMFATTTQGVGGYMVNTSGTVERIYLAFAASDTVGFTLGSAANGISSSALQRGVWHHVVGIWSGTTGTLYVDNASIGSFSFTTLASVQNPMYIGSFAGSQGFKGLLDDVRFYSRALTATEVTTIYRAGSTELQAGNNLGQMGQWSFDEGGGTLIGDFSGYGNNAIPYPGTAGTNTATSSMWVAGKKGTAMRFDGTDDRAFMSPTTNLNGATKFTWAGWVYFNDLSSHSAGSCPFGDQQIFQRGSSGSFNGYIYMGLSGSNFGIDLEDGVSFQHINTSTPVSAGRWYHLAAVADTSNFLLYVDGVAKTPVSYGGLYPLMTAGSVVGSRTQFGECDYSVAQGPTAFFSGRLDDVHVYNRALSAGEIYTLFKAGGAAVNVPQTDKLTSGLVGFWSFNGKDMVSGVAKDRSGLGNDGNLVNISTTTFYSIGKVGQGAAFDGINDYINAGSGIPATGVTERTLSVWLKRNGTAANQFIAGQWNGTNGIFIQSLTSAADGLLVLAGDGNQYGTVSVSTQSWVHAVLVYDGSLSGNSNRLKLYVNGVLQTLSFGAITIPASVTTGGNFLIGSLLGSSRFWPGSQDEVRAYTRALTATEIQQLYLLGK